jgi:hypothetical protein
VSYTIGGRGGFARAYRISPLLFAAILFLSAIRASAGIRPSFCLEECGWHATDIVVAAQSAKPGTLTLIDVWKGDLKPGAAIRVADLQIAPITVAIPFGIKPPVATVTGARFVLFLRRVAGFKSSLVPPALPAFTGIARFGGTQVSAVWIEQNRAYAFQQVMNPGPTELCALGQTETELRKQTLALLAAKNGLRQAEAIISRSDRARALQPMTSSLYWDQSGEAFSALGNCGKDALPLLRPMLDDNLHNESELVNALAAAAGTDAGEELVSVICKEFDYWEKTAPSLKHGWWNADPAEQRGALRARYETLDDSLCALAKCPYPPALEVVTRLRGFWSSLPSLNDSGFDIVYDCDQVLKGIVIPAGPIAACGASVARTAS